MNNTVFAQAQITYAPVAQELNGLGLQRHHWAHENSSVIWSAMSSPCWSLPHLLTSSPPQYEAQPGQHDLLQDDTVHRAPLPEPIQLKSSANEPLSHVNYESGRKPRKTSPAGYEPKELATSKGTWSMVLLIVRGLLRRPSLSGSPTVTFCSVHIHNVVAKKRDASTELLQRLHGYVREHNVDFIGGDFNMSAFSKCLKMLNSQHLAIHFCGDLVHWRSRIVNVLGFSSCQGVLTSGVCIHMAATRLTMLRLAWDLETNLLISRCSFIFALLICPDPAASCVVSKHNKEELSADTTKNVCREDVHDRAPVHQGVCECFFSHTSEVACEPLASLLFLASPLTH